MTHHGLSQTGKKRQESKTNNITNRGDYRERHSPTTERESLNQQENEHEKSTTTQQRRTIDRICRTLPQRKRRMEQRLRTRNTQQNEIIRQHSTTPFRNERGSLLPHINQHYYRNPFRRTSWKGFSSSTIGRIIIRRENNYSTH